MSLEILTRKPYKIHFVGPSLSHPKRGRIGMHVDEPRERVVVADDVPGVLGTLGQSALKKVHICRGLQPFQRGLQHGGTRTGISVCKQGRIFGGHARKVCRTRPPLGASCLPSRCVWLGRGGCWGQGAGLEAVLRLQAIGSSESCKEGTPDCLQKKGTPVWAPLVRSKSVLPIRGSWYRRHPAVAGCLKYRLSRRR